MAHGFRYIPRERKARQPDNTRCGFCGARFDVGMLPHICKEVTWGTAVTPPRTIPFTKTER